MTKSSEHPQVKKSGSVNIIQKQSLETLLKNYCPLLEGEDKKEFINFRDSCLSALQPNDAVELVWTLEFSNYVWEIQRLRGIKAEIIRGNREPAVRNLQSDFGRSYLETEDFAKKWSAGNKEIVEEMQKNLIAHRLNSDAINATAFQLSIGDIERLDILIDSYACRRDKAIRELDHRRDFLARHAREFADKFQDVEFEDIPED